MVELIKEFPLSDIGGQMMEEKIRKVAYTKQEVNIMIDRAVKVAVEELEYLKYLRNRLFAMMSDYNYTEMRSFEVDEP